MSTLYGTAIEGFTLPKYGVDLTPIAACYNPLEYNLAEKGYS
jgi:hypothetical protein